MARLRTLFFLLTLVLVNVGVTLWGLGQVTLLGIG